MRPYNDEISTLYADGYISYQDVLHASTQNKPDASFMGEPSNLNKKTKTLPPTKYPKTLHQNTFNTKKTQIPTEGTPQTNQNNANQFEGEPPTHTPSLEQTPNPPLNNSIPKHPKLLSRIFRNEKTVKFDYICLHFINDHIGGNC